MNLGRHIHYKLNERNEPVPCELDEWAKWFENADRRRVARSEIGTASISTVFLGIDHAMDDEDPVLWETMIFAPENEELDHYCDRYSSHDAALAGHKKAVSLVRSSV